MKALLYLLLLSSLAHSEESVLKACYTSWYPFSYTENGEAVGFSISVYKDVLAKAGLEVEFSELPWARCKAEFNAGNFDVIVDGGTKTQNTLFVKNRPIPWVIVLWTHKNSEHQKFDGLSQFDHEIVSQVRGYGYPEAFMAYSGFGKRDMLSSDLQGLKMLNAKRVDVFIGDLLSSQWLMQNNNFDIRPLLPPLQVRYLTLSFSKQREMEHKSFEIALESMVSV